MLTIFDLIDQCQELALTPYKKREISDIKFILIHRFNVPEFSGSGVQVARFFQDKKHLTRGQMPYHCVVRTNGVVDQCVVSEHIGMAATPFNKGAVQIACIGDFRKEAPSMGQVSALIHLCKEIRSLYGPIDIFGHTEKVRTRNSEYSKICPGKYLDIPSIRQAVTQLERNLHGKSDEDEKDSLRS